MNTTYQLPKDDGVFHLAIKDNKVGMCAEDKKFLSIMDKEVVKKKDGHWVYPPSFPKRPSVIAEEQSTFMKHLLRELMRGKDRSFGWYRTYV